MKYFILTLILLLASCSLNKNVTYWNEDPIKNSLEKKKLSKILQKPFALKTITFEEFTIFLKDYSNKKNYPVLDN